MSRVGAFPPPDDSFLLSDLPPQLDIGSLPQKATSGRPLLLKVGIVVGTVAILTAIIVPSVLLTLPKATTQICEGVTAEECQSSVADDYQDVADNCQENVHTCSGEACDGCDGNCCGAVFDDAIATCSDGSSVPYKNVVNCSCQPCDSLKLSMSGRIYGACEGDSCAMSVRITGTEVTKSDTDGYFSFETTYPNTGSRLVLTVSDSGGNYNQQSMTVSNIERSTQSYVNIRIQVFEAYESRLFSAEEGLQATLSNNSDVALEIEGGKLVDENGEVYNGTVTASIGFIDTASENDTERITGELTVNVNGTETPMISFGMISVDLTTSNGSRLAGNITITVDYDSISDPDNTYIWAFDEVTGEWTIVSSLRVTAGGTGRRRKRETSELTAQISITGARRIWNLDALLTRYCYVSVRILETETSSQQISGVQVVSVYKRESGSWANYIRRRSSWYYSNLCLQTPCAIDRRTAVVKVQMIAPSGYYVANPAVSEDVKSAVNYTAGTHWFDISIPTSGVPISQNGPFYDYWFGCYYPTNENSYFLFTRTQPTSTTEGTVTDEMVTSSGDGTGLTTTNAIDPITGDTFTTNFDETTTTFVVFTSTAEELTTGSVNGTFTTDQPTSADTQPTTANETSTEGSGDFTTSFVTDEQGTSTAEATFKTEVATSAVTNSPSVNNTSTDGVDGTTMSLFADDTTEGTYETEQSTSVQTNATSVSDTSIEASKDSTTSFTDTTWVTDDLFSSSADGIYETSQATLTEQNPTSKSDTSAEHVTFTEDGTNVAVITTEEGELYRDDEITTTEPLNFSETATTTFNDIISSTVEDASNITGDSSDNPTKVSTTEDSTTFADEETFTGSTDGTSVTQRIDSTTKSIFGSGDSSDGSGYSGDSDA